MAAATRSRAGRGKVLVATHSTADWTLNTRAGQRTGGICLRSLTWAGYWAGRLLCWRGLRRLWLSGLSPT